jgi:hypothetical protein
VSDLWHEFAVYSDAASAEVAAGLLRSEGVPVDIRSDVPVPGLIQGFSVRVPANMVHRAEWVLANAEFSEEELAFIATGHLGQEGPGESR